MENKQISIIIPVYNTQIALLHKCISSILDEDEACEIIIVDDGSQQNVANACDEYNNIDYVSVIHQPNQGVSVARNKGVENAKNDYIMFVDPDDYLIKGWGQSIRNQLEDNCDVYLFSYYQQFGNGYYNVNITDFDQMRIENLVNDTLYSADFYSKYLVGAIWNKVFRRSFLIDNGIMFDERLRKSQDREFVVNVLTRNPKIKYIDMPVYVYVQNFDSVCNRYKKDAWGRNFMLWSVLENGVNNNKYNIKNWKYLSARVRISLYFESVYISTFHVDNTNSVLNKIHEAKYWYEMYRIGEACSLCNVRQFFSINEKVKFVLIKNKAYLTLMLLIKYRQKKLRKK